MYLHKNINNSQFSQVFQIARPVFIPMQVWVEWFGSGSTVSMVDVANVRPLEEGVKTRGAFKNKKKKKLEKAISLARKALQAK